jgi:hypothetical protein
MSETSALIEAAASRFVESYRAAFSQKNPVLLSKELSPDCSRTVLPSGFLASLGQVEKALSNQEYEAALQWELPGYKTNQVTLRRTEIDDRKKSATVWVEFAHVLTNEKQYRLDFLFLLDMNDSCDSIKAITQFLDTAKCGECFAQIAQIKGGEESH